MSDQTNVFDAPNDNSGQPATQQPQTSNPFADQLAGIKTEEGKQKYDTIEKALDGLTHAQDYIPQLKTQVNTQEAEINKLRAELEQRQSVEDVVSRLTSQQQAPAPAETPQVSQGLSEERVANLVQQQIAQTQAQAAEVTNKQKVNASLVGKFGNKAGEVVAEKAKALNTTPQQLEAMAASNPDMVLALFNTQATSGVSTTTGSINIPPTAPSEREPLARPEKSLLSGATAAQQKEFMQKVKAEVYAKFGVVQ
jgi:hypothetical protein